MGGVCCRLDGEGDWGRDWEWFRGWTREGGVGGVRGRRQGARGDIGGDSSMLGEGSGNERGVDGLRRGELGDCS
jgi:hypothetical protein